MTYQWNFGSSGAPLPTLDRQVVARVVEQLAKRGWIDNPSLVRHDERVEQEAVSLVEQYLRRQLSAHDLRQRLLDLTLEQHDVPANVHEIEWALDEYAASAMTTAELRARLEAFTRASVYA